MCGACCAAKAVPLYVAAMGPTPLEAGVSMNAMRLSLGLSVVTGEVVLPAPVGRVCDAPLIGMAVKREGTAPIGTHRVLLLVRGTKETECEPLEEQTLKVCSSAVRCLLTEEPAYVDIVGNGGMKKMLH